MENETIESVVNTTETQLQDKIKERRTKKKRINVAEVMADISAGLTLKQLANKYNCQYPAFYNYKELKDALQARKSSKKQAILQQIADLTSQGLNNKEIAARLGVSLVTLRKWQGGKVKKRKDKEIEIPVEPKVEDSISPAENENSMIPAPAKAELDADKYGTDSK